MHSKTELKAGIIGAGIAGLCAAIALRRAGWHVEIFEKSSFKNEVGAAIAVAPNGTRVLRRFGADLDAWGGTDNMQLRMPRGDTLQEIYKDSFTDVPSQYGARWLFFHRVDLHSGLRHMAEDPDLTSAPPARINLGAEVASIDCAAGMFVLANGSIIKADLIVIANGVHCQFVETVTNKPSPTIKTGMTVYRCLIPMSAVLSDPVTAPLFENQPPGLLGPNIPAHRVICASYPCRKNKVLNLACLRETGEQHETANTTTPETHSWNRPVPQTTIEDLTRGFHPAIQALPRKATDIKAYEMLVRPEIPTFTNGRAVLIGDAAHPMLMYHGQGATISIESTGALETFFSNVTSAEQIPQRLKWFNEFRHGRCIAAQVLSNVPPKPDGSGYEGMLARIRRYYGGTLPEKGVKPWGSGIRDFFFGFDVWMEGEAFLKAKMEGL